MRPTSSDITLGVLGLGHVGLPTAIGLAELGWKVIGSDDYTEKADQIRGGVAPFYEPGLVELLRSNLDSGNFIVGRSVEETIEKSDAIFVCVGTPQNEDGSADLSQIEAVGRVIAQNASSDLVVVEKSTTPVSTAKRLKDTMTRYSRDNLNIDVAVNPEFLREGSGMKDFFNPDRIVLGVESEAAKGLLLKIYAPLLARADNLSVEMIDQNHPKYLITDLNTAELIKHASNSFLATKISFINAVADICDQVGADVMNVSKGMGMDPRIGNSFLNPGLGFGGYCLPKDVKAFTKIGEDLGVDMSLFKSVSKINESRVGRIVTKLKDRLWVLNGKVAAIWGLSFKPGTDDIRESPSLSLVEALVQEGMKVKLHDPEALDAFKEVRPNRKGVIEYYETPEEAAEGAYVIILATEWECYGSVDFSIVKESMEYPLVIDGRNFLDPVLLGEAGLEYVGTGREETFGKPRVP